MKKLYPLFLAFLIMISCSKKEQYRLGFRIPVGQQIEIYQTQSMEMENFMEKENQKIKSILETWSKWSIAGYRKDSIMEIKHTYERFISNIVMGDSIKISDSNDPSTMKSSEDSEMNSLAVLIGRTIDLSINKNGKVIDFKGTESIKEEILKDSAAYGKPFDVFLENLSNEGMKAQFDVFHIYPDKPVKVGDTWNAEWSMSYGITFKINNTYTLRNVVGDTAVIDISGLVSTSNSTSKIDAKNPMAALSKMMTINGKYSGEIKSDIKTGFIYKNEQTFDVKAEINMLGMKLPMNMMGSTSLKMTKVN